MRDVNQFAAEWIAAWNAHDVEAILTHYADDVEYTSPFIAKLTGGGATLRGKDAVRDYLRRGLAAFPELHFTLLETYSGTDSAVLRYRSVRNLIAAETFQFDAHGRVKRVLCHYHESAA